jgi:hypothetical protein
MTRFGASRRAWIEESKKITATCEELLGFLKVSKVFGWTVAREGRSGATPFGSREFSGLLEIQAMFYP